MDEDELIDSSTIRGIVLFGGVALAAWLAFRYYQSVKANEVIALPQQIKIPVELPGRKVPKAFPAQTQFGPYAQRWR